MWGTDGAEGMEARLFARSRQEAAMVGQGGGAHCKDCTAKEVQQCPTVSVCFVPRGFVG